MNPSVWAESLPFFPWIHPRWMQVLPSRGMVMTEGLHTGSDKSPLPVVKASVRARTYMAVARLLTLMHLAGFFSETMGYSSKKSEATPWSWSNDT